MRITNCAASEIFTSLIAMTLAALFMDLAVRLQSTEFLRTVRHAEHPTAFSRQRKLPLATLVALMLTGMRMSIQAELEAHLAFAARLTLLLHKSSYSIARLPNS